MEEFTVVKGKRYKAEIQLSGFEVMADNDKIANILSEAGFSNIDVTGEGDTREVQATWPGETVTGPIDRHIYNLAEVIEVKPIPVINPIVPPNYPPVFEKEK